MKRISDIAKNELFTLFYSPIAWILMILFLVLTSADYIDITSDFIGMFQRGGPYLARMENLTLTLTTNPSPKFGYLLGVIKNLYIFFPLITMGLISKETSSGTMKLLHSSPIRIREIVLGKYAAMLCFTFSLLLLLLFTLAGLSMSVTHIDYGQLFASVVGLFLVLATFAAIGLFISSLTSYQIIAAIITLAVFIFLSKVGDLGQDIDMIRDITYFMNIGGKALNVIRGLLSVRDFCYFMILIGTFLSFTILRIKSATESISRFKMIMRYVIVVMVASVIGYITNKPQFNGYVDATRDKIHTITPPTQAMLAKLNDGELEITAFANLLNYSFRSFVPTEQNKIINYIFGPYIRFKPDIKMKFEYYYNTDSNSYYFKSNPGKTLREIAEREAISYGVDVNKFLPPAEVNKMVNITKEEFRCFFRLKYKGRSAIVRVFDDPQFWPSEDEIAAAINRLIAPVPKIMFLSDEIERGPFSERGRDYKFITSQLGNRYALINQGYDFDTLSLKQQPIEFGITALVIADPRSPMTSEGLEKVNNYIDAGGNLLLSAEPDRRSVTLPLLEKLGLSLKEGLLIQNNDKYSSDCVFAYLTDSAKKLSPQFSHFLKNEIKYYADSNMRVSMAGAGAIEYKEKDGFSIDPLLQTDKELSWNRRAPIPADSLQLKVNRQPNDETGSFLTALRLHRTINGKEQRIIVTSDADFLTTAQIRGGYNPKRYNSYFGFWAFSYFSYGLFPANTMRPESSDNSFKVTLNGFGKQKLIFYWILPALLAIFASVILIRRKRK